MGGNEPGAESGSGSTEEEEYDPKKVYIDRSAPAYQEQQWQEVENRKGWSSYTAEQMYGDAWNEETGQWEEWAADDLDYRRSVTGNEGGKSGYYMTPSDDSPPQIGQAPNENRYQEWLAYMRRENPGVDANSLTIQDWADWELGIYNDYIGTVHPQPSTPPPGPWQRWIDEGVNVGGSSGGTQQSSGGTSSAMPVASPQRESRATRVGQAVTPFAFPGGVTPSTQPPEDLLDTAFGGSTPMGTGFDVPTSLPYYGYSTDYGMSGTNHTGLDVMVPLYSPIYAPVSGVVTCVGCWSNDHMTGGVGRIEIEMDDGVHVLFDHSSGSLVEVGDQVYAGQQIGTSGGMNSPHIHMEVRVPDYSQPSGWRLIDPVTYFEQVAMAA
jgi:murein DD-endopeptidase MepM/ murein hydrolase activator NlpD